MPTSRVCVALLGATSGTSTKCFNGKTHRFRQHVYPSGNVRDTLLQSSHIEAAVKRFFRKL